MRAQGWCAANSTPAPLANNAHANRLCRRAAHVRNVAFDFVAGSPSIRARRLRNDTQPPCRSGMACCLSSSGRSRVALVWAPRRMCAPFPEDTPMAAPCSRLGSVPIQPCVFRWPVAGHLLLRGHLPVVRLAAHHSCLGPPASFLQCSNAAVQPRHQQQASVAVESVSD